MSQIDDALNIMLGKQKKKKSSSSMIPNLGLSSMFPNATKKVYGSSFVQGIKKETKKAFNPLFQLADTSKILGGASIQKQNQWNRMTPKKRASARKKYPDRDGDRVPDRFDCQPKNVWRQDSNRGGIKLGDAKSMKQIPHRFIFVIPSTLNYAMKIWGYDSVKQFEDETGYDRKDLYNTFLESSGDIRVPAKHYSAYDVYRSKRKLSLLYGNPSRLVLESFEDYMAMYYNFENGYMYNK